MKSETVNAKISQIELGPLAHNFCGTRKYPSRRSEGGIAGGGVEGVTDLQFVF